MLATLRDTSAETLAHIDAEKELRGTPDVFLLFTLGSQFDHLINMAISRLGFFCLVADPTAIMAADVKKIAPRGIILSGGPASAYNEPPPFDTAIFDLGIPVLGICLGFQVWAAAMGASVQPAHRREFGQHQLTITRDSVLFSDLPQRFQVLESHGDRVEEDLRLEVLAQTENAPVAAARHDHLWGVQFHPEVSHTEHGERILENFCVAICGAHNRFPAANVAYKKIVELQRTIGSGRVLLALSGGSDSSVVAYLLKEALADSAQQLAAVYIRGIDRPDDEAHVRHHFGQQPWLTLQIENATDRFLKELRGVTEPHAKRVAVRTVYKQVLEDVVRRCKANFIAQGTLYTDISESGLGYESGARKARIKLHHNVDLRFSRPELAPLVDCVKDTARAIGREINVPAELLTRHPFPGPGLVVRIEDDVTAEKLAMARQLDTIFMEEIHRWQLYEAMWQAGVRLTRGESTCSMGDDAATGRTACYWAVESVNGFTAQPAELPWPFCLHVSRRMVNEVRGISRAMHDTTEKPPATIEWE